MGGARGGREAAEISVRSFLEDYYAQPPTLGVERAVAGVLDAVNRWICRQGRTDPGLSGMGTTFSGLVLLGRQAHVVHVGDSRIYRLSEADGLTPLTEDHTLQQPDVSHVLYRAIGIEESLRLDYSVHPVRRHDRFLLSTDGVHGALPNRRIAELLAVRQSPEWAARALVNAALAAGGRDNATALVLDVLSLPAPDRASLEGILKDLPLAAMPRKGESIDGFVLTDVLANGRYAKLFRAHDERTGQTVVLKFPHLRPTGVSHEHAAFLREAWTAARVRSPYLGQVLEFAPERRTRLYSAMPFYAGETLERRLRRAPKLTLEEGVALGVKMAKAAAALHRAGVIHRDIKPDNVILEQGGGLKLLDLGAARIPKLEEEPPPEIPGTPSYMAPELFDGVAGDERTDIYALGVTLFRAFTCAFPYGEVEPFTRPRPGRRMPLSQLRPDLPVWLDSVLGKAVALDPALRQADMLELAFDLESGPMGSREPVSKLPLYERNPLLVWQVLAFALFLAVLALLMT